jgi:hypothetical protein
MDDLVKRAETYARHTHRRIDQRRKYTNQPYDAHLKAVVDILRTVSDDPELLAAAWLHDTLEDTPATYEDLETEFGTEVADLVAELTDVSRTSDGNRAVRKAIDRAHLARASSRAKTIKLADLIDNCRDIVKHDERFGRVFVTEASAMLEVLQDGNARLYAQASKLISRSAERLDLPAPRQSVLLPDAPLSPAGPEPFFFKQRVVRLFADCFRATDIAEPLRSFDSTRDPQDIARVLEEHDLSVAGIRIDGHMMGYVRRADLEAGIDDRAMRGLTSDHIVDGDASLADVIHVLTRYNHCFVTLLGEVVGCISRADIQKPVVRMWLFGIVTLIELEITERVRARWPGDSWQELLTAGRLDKARELQAERDRRGIRSDLFDCLQLTDKALILFESTEALADLGFRSKRSAKSVLRELESLRNNLAHAQDIVTYDWAQIVRIVRRIEEMSYQIEGQ